MVFREGVFIQAYFNTYDYLNKGLDSNPSYYSYIVTNVSGGVGELSSFIPDSTQLCRQIFINILYGNFSAMSFLYLGRTLLV